MDYEETPRIPKLRISSEDTVRYSDITVIFVILPEKPEDTKYLRIPNTRGYQIPEDTEYQRIPNTRGYGILLKFA